MSRKESWTLFFFISKLKILCKFWQTEASVSDFEPALRVQAVRVVYIVGGEVWHVFTSARSELNDVAGRQQSDQVDEKQKPFVCHPTHCVDDKWGLSLVGAEHILYYLNVILVVIFTSRFPIINHFLRCPLVGERWS